MRAALAPLVEGRTIVDAGGHPSAKFVAARRGRRAPTIERVGRRGKYLLVDLDDGRDLVVHLGMTGRLRLRARSTTATIPTCGPGGRSTTARSSSSATCAGSAGSRSCRRGRHDALPTLAALGPEPFAEAFTPEALWQAPPAVAPRVKTQLLQQRVVAGRRQHLRRRGAVAGRRRPRGTEGHPATGGSPPRRDPRGARRGLGQRRDDAARLPHRRRRHGQQPAPPRLLRPGRASPAFAAATTLRRKVLDGRGTTWCPVCQRR